MTEMGKSSTYFANKAEHGLFQLGPAGNSPMGGQNINIAVYVGQPIGFISPILCSDRHILRWYIIDIFPAPTASDKSLVLEALWQRSGGQIRNCSDVGDPLPEVLGYSRHDTLYSETRPVVEQNGTRSEAKRVGVSEVRPSSEPRKVGAGVDDHLGYGVPPNHRFSSGREGGSGYQSGRPCVC